MASGDPAVPPDTRLTSACALSRLVARGLAVRGVRGRIVSVSSGVGRLCRSGDIGYTTAEAGAGGGPRTQLLLTTTF